MTIVVTGGSGFIGTTLTKALLGFGHTVVVVAKKAPPFTHEHLYFINGDLATQSLPYNILERTDAVIHLVGRTMFRKWNDEVKEEIRQSRVESTKRIVESIAATTNRPPVFICASSTAFYGDTGEETVDENSPKGQGFLPDMVEEWEAAAKGASEYGVRVVCLRTAPVIGQGGLLSLIRKVAKYGFIWKLKKEPYTFSWIHENDIVNAYLFALETNTLQGVVNAVAPEQVTEETFIRTVAKILKRKYLGTMPRALSTFLYGELYNEITKNSRVAPKRLLDKGFEFQYPTIDAALLAIKKK
jgi:uncharacterized protein